MTRLQVLARKIELETGLKPSRWDAEHKVMTRGFGFGKSNPGDGAIRYELELYDGTGSGITRVLLWAVGFGAFDAKVRAFCEGWTYAAGWANFPSPAVGRFKELAEAVLHWAATPGDHGGNPYCLDFVRIAQRVVSPS